MKIKAVFCTLLSVAFLLLAFSSESLIESRLFMALSITAGLLFFRLAATPVTVPDPKQQQQVQKEPDRMYAPTHLYKR